MAWEMPGLLGKPLTVDCHSHLIPQSWYLDSTPRSTIDLDALFAQQDEAGVNLTVFGNNWIRIPPGLSRLDAIREYNAFAAELTARFSHRLVGLASAVPFEGDDYLREVERAVRQDGLKGIMIGTSVDGEYLDSRRADPFWELVTRLDVPLFLHPPRETIGHEHMEIFRLPEMVGRPFDTTLTLARMIYTGVLERYPTLKLVCAHVGGAISMLAGRLNFGYEMRHDATFGPWEPDVLSKPPSDYISQVYLDTMSFHVPAVMCAVSTVGVDHVVYGSDYPPVPIPLKRSVAVVENLPISHADKEKILGLNAARLLKLG